MQLLVSENQAKHVFLSTLLVVVMAALGQASDIGTYYEISEVETPEAIEGRVDGLSFSPAGTLFVCFHQAGRVYRYNPDESTWDLFAAGLHDPMGIHAVSEQEAIVMQRAELTQIEDVDGDERAEQYRTLFDDFGMTGELHELNYGPVVGPDGNYYVALSTTAETETLDEFRGEFRPKGSGPTKMRSNVPYRGWIFRVTPDGDHTAWASGVRSPNGLMFDQDGRLFYTDNQGDWVGTNKLFHVRRGQFYGHGASLIWKEDFTGNPWKVSLRRFARLRTRAAVQFPYGKLNGSITQPVQDTTGGQFGPFSGQILVGDFNHPVIWRIMLEEVNGKLQGACVPFYQGNGLRRASNRLVFGPNNQLWVGHTDRKVASWSGTTGLQKIRWKGGVPPAVREMHLVEDGFVLRFTKSLDRKIAARPDAYSFTRFYYEYHRKYGSERHDENSVAVKKVEVSNGGKRVRIELAEDIQPGYLYELNMEDLKTEKGRSLIGRFVTYTVNRTTDGRRAPLQIPSARKKATKPDKDAGEK